MNKPRLLALLLVVASSVAYAGPFADDLGKCLVRSTTQDDKAVLVRWIFSMMALHPNVRDLATVPDERRVDSSKAAAGLFQALLTKSCNGEAKLALTNEGPSVFESSFNVLGQVAGRELFADQTVLQGLAGFVQNLDKSALAAALQ